MENPVQQMNESSPDGWKVYLTWESNQEKLAKHWR